MNDKCGVPVRGILHSDDASGGVVIPLYLMGETGDAYTLKDDEYLEIHHIDLITAPGGACHVNIGADAAAAAGEYVIRGTYTANGGYGGAKNFAGERGHLAYATAPAGVLDVTFSGTIRKCNNNVGARPSWESTDYGK